MAEIDRLTVVFDANFKQLDDKLNKVIRSNFAAASRIEKQWNTANDNIARRLGKGFATKAQEGLEELGSRAGAAGDLLGEFGAAGLAASAVLGGLALAANRAMEAMAFGDELQTEADKIGTSAERLQELKFAAEETDVPLSALDGNLQKLNATLGAFKTGVGDTRVKSAFQALRIKPEDLNGIESAVEALPLLADRLGKVGTTAEQVQLARRLGIEDLLPMLREGSEGLDEMSKRARDLGLVLSNETVKGLAEADRQMELATRQIETNMRAAFSGLAFDIAKSTTAVLEFINELKKAQPAMEVYLNSLSKFASGGFIGVAREAINQTNRQMAERVMGEPFPTTGKILERFGRGSAAVDRDEIGRVAGDGEAEARKAAAEAKARRANERRITQEILAAQIATLDAHNDERRSIEDRLVFSLDRLDLERKARKLELDALEEDRRENPSTGISQAQRARIEALEEEARSAKERRLREKAAQDLADLALSREREAVDVTLDLLSIQESMADTAAERRKLQLEMLDRERAAARKARETELNRDTNLTPEQRAASLADFDRVTDAQRGAVVARTRGPIEAYTESLRNLDDVIQNEAIGAFQSLADSLGDSAAKALGLKGVWGQFVGQILSLQVQRSGSGLLSLLSKIPGFAGGTNFAPGGLAWVGEKGKELVNLPRGSQVIPNHALKPIQQVQPRSVTVLQPMQFDLRGAVMTPQLLAQMNQMVAQGAMISASAGSAQAQAAMQRRSQRSLR